MSERCATCVHWHRDGDGTPLDMGFCWEIAVDFDANTPRANPLASPSMSGHPSRMVRPWPMTGKALLSTRADFGCALWQPNGDEGA